MIDTLVQLDIELFKWIHVGLQNYLLDSTMPLLRNKLFWLPLYLFFVGLALYKYKWKGLIIVLLTILAVAIADQFSANLIKNWIQRIRPCNDVSLAQHIRHLVDCGGGYSFISAHATNHFTLAVIFTWFFKTLLKHKIMNYLFYIWAGLIAFAQVYVGVHFPLDVILGSISGIIIGSGMLKLIKFLMNKIN